MEKEELLKYEMPSIAEFVSVGFLQTILARYTAWKINKKWARYVARQEREKWIKSKGLIYPPQ